MNDTISIRKDSAEGQFICSAAESIGINPSDLLAGVCINAKRRGRVPALPAPAPVQEAHPEPTPAPKLPPAPSSGILKGLPAA